MRARSAERKGRAGRGFVLACMLVVAHFHYSRWLTWWLIININASMATAGRVHRLGH